MPCPLECVAPKIDGMKAGRPSQRPDRLRTLPPALGRRLSHRRTAVVMALLIIIVVLGLAATCTPAARQRPLSANGPNIVFVLTDDLSGNLVRYMPHVLAMQR